MGEGSGIDAKQSNAHQPCCTDMLTAIGFSALTLAIVLLFAAVGAQTRKIDELQAQVAMLQTGAIISTEHALSIGAVVQSLGERAVLADVQEAARVVH